MFVLKILKVTFNVFLFHWVILCYTWNRKLYRAQSIPTVGTAAGFGMIRDELGIIEFYLMNRIFMYEKRF